MCVCVCLCACVRASVCMCMRACEKEKNDVYFRAFSTAPVYQIYRIFYSSTDHNEMVQNKTQYQIHIYIHIYI